MIIAERAVVVVVVVVVILYESRVKLR